MDALERVTELWTSTVGASVDIEDEKTLFELAKLHDVHANQIIDWKKQLLSR